MKHFQIIAIGLLGLTHPEMFIPRWKPDTTSATKIEPSYGRGSREGHNRQEGRGARAMRALKLLYGSDEG
jgi:hypothetical protein